MIGEREGDDLRRIGRKALFENNRHAKGSLQASVDRRERQFREAEGSDRWISNKFEGFTMEEGAA
eukprot:791696-Pyramimonas_sp.AAC.1